jgi:hypothetical protein
VNGAERFTAVVVAAVRRFDMEEAGDPAAEAVFMGRLEEIDAARHATRELGRQQAARLGHAL